ncbi:hypothetical protein G7072_09335 [Nocardioides sp. HDW12B]|uniref:hypothetical protein n=1 Tax=Nocardioides sp. HDW12B TaxID=2714939 RepID=UPI00140A0E02|nr:hypothetical protein [Nocardioides sp. HDW12B]QIK66527.1 hypothetical protein G7072_09335 [Nocardioides sp. HDW12B]
MDGGHDQRPETARARVVPVRVDTYEPSSGIVTGGVARGVQMARQAAPPVQTPVHHPHPTEET